MKTIQDALIETSMDISHMVVIEALMLSAFTAGQTYAYIKHGIGTKHFNPQETKSAFDVFVMNVPFIDPNSKDN